MRNPYLDIYRNSTKKITNLFTDIKHCELLVSQFTLLYAALGCLLSDFQSLVSCALPKSVDIIQVDSEPREATKIARPKEVKMHGPRKSQPLPQFEALNKGMSELAQFKKPKAPDMSLGFSGLIEMGPSQLIGKGSRREGSSENSRKSGNVISSYLQRNSMQVKEKEKDQNFFDAIQKKRPLYKM